MSDTHPKDCPCCIPLGKCDSPSQVVRAYSVCYESGDPMIVIDWTDETRGQYRLFSYVMSQTDSVLYPPAVECARRGLPLYLESIME